MTSSGSIAFNPSVTQLITEAFRDCDIIAEDESPTADQYTSAIFKLNSIVAGLQGTGIHVWAESEAIVFLEPYQKRYVLGAPSPTPSANSADADSWIQAYVAQQQIAGATTLQLVSAAGVVQGDNLGVVVNSGNAGTFFWTTVAAAPVGNLVTLASPLPAGVSSNAIVTDYPAGGQINRPLKVPSVRLLTFGQSPSISQPNRTGNIETPMTRLSRQQYEDLPQKDSPGVPTQFYYSPQRDRGWLYVWPVALLPIYAARITWYRPLQDFFAPNNTMDFPQEWAAPLRYLLSDELKLSYSVPEPRATRIEKKALEWTTIISGWDRDSEDVQFGMDSRYR